MDLQSLITSLLVPTVIALAGAVVYLWQEQRRVLFSQLKAREDRIATLEKREIILESRIADLEKLVSQLKQDNAGMQARFILFASSHDSSPLPTWIKDRDGKVLAANRAYERTFLRPRGHSLADYVGRCDADVWPEHVAAEYAANDNAVLRTGEIWDGEENVPDAAGKSRSIRIIKYPRRAKGIAEPFGVAGIAILDEL